MSLSDRLFCNHHAHPHRPHSRQVRACAHPLRQAWSYRLRYAKEVFVWFKSRLNPWYISIPSNPNLYSTKIIVKMRWQTIVSSVSMRTISSIATPLPTAYDCVAVYIAGHRTNLVVYGCRPKPTTKKNREAGLLVHVIIMDSDGLAKGVLDHQQPQWWLDYDYSLYMNLETHQIMASYVGKWGTNCFLCCCFVLWQRNIPWLI